MNRFPWWVSIGRLLSPLHLGGSQAGDAHPSLLQRFRDYQNFFQCDLVCVFNLTVQSRDSNQDSAHRKDPQVSYLCRRQQERNVSSAHYDAS